MLQFWIPVLAFHVLFGGVVWWVASRWRQRLAKPAPGWLWALQALADAILLAFAMLVIAVLAVAPRGGSGFLVQRLLCQALFGELVLLSGWLAWAHWRAGAASRALRLRALAPAVLALLLLLVYVEAYHRGPYDLRVRTHTVDISGGRPQARTLRILHLSDLQTHAIRPYEERALRLAKAQNADLIVFTGDYLQRRQHMLHTPRPAELHALLRRVDLRAPLGVYAVEGDTEHHWPKPIQGSGIRRLSNSHALLILPDGKRLALIGLLRDRSREEDAAQLRRILDAAPPSDLRVVIGHAPEFVRALPRDGSVHLALAGHTHGGQVVLPFVGPPITASTLPRRYAGGLHLFEGIPLHVSRGIGMERGSAPQIRFLCPPEICVLEVRY